MKDLYLPHLPTHLAPSATRLATVAAVLLSLGSVAAQTTWKAAVSGSWIDPGAWTAGIPEANTANLTPSDASYTVTVDAAPTTPHANLNISTAAGCTTRLQVNTELVATNAYLTFGRSAEVVVGAGGIMRYLGGTSSYPVVKLENGALWRIDGGEVDYLCAPPPAGGRSYVYVGHASSGRVEVASGTLRLRGTTTTPPGNNSSLYVGIGTGTGGRGELAMTGGQLVLSCYNAGGTTALRVGAGDRAIGTATLSNNAMLVSSNWVAIGGSTATGIVTVADSAVFRVPKGRVLVGAHTHAFGSLTVRDDGLLDLSDDSGLYLGGYDNTYRDGTGILNVQGGSALIGNGCAVGLSRNGTRAYGEVNVSGGVLALGIVNGYGLVVGNGNDAIGRGCGKLTVSGGLLDLSRLMWNQTGLSLNGLAIGVASVAGGVGHGEAVFSGGTVTNSGQFGVGCYLGGTGIVWQTGGVVRQGIGRSGVIGWPLTLGWGGGTGTYRMSGGTFTSAKPVFVGGLLPSDLGYTPPAPFASGGSGTLRLEGGTFSVDGQTVYVGRNGNGTLEVCAGATCAMQDLVFADTATLRFVLGSDGSLGRVTLAGSAVVAPGARLEIDASAYRGTPLVLYTAAFQDAQISFTGRVTVQHKTGKEDFFCPRTPLTNYVAVAGSDANDGSAEHPWATLVHALAQTTYAGDTVRVGPGTFTVPHTRLWGAELARGVNLVGDGQDRTLITLDSAMTNVNECVLALRSPSGLVNGNQTLAHFTVDGINHGPRTAVWCTYRHNLIIDHVTIRNGYREALKIEGFAAGTPWPNPPPDSVYCTNVVIRNCTFANSGLSPVGANWSYGTLGLYSVRNLRMWNCVIDERVYGGWPVKGIWIKDSAIHNSDFWVCPPTVKPVRDFSIELWYCLNCEFFDNRLNGSYSITTRNTRIHHNDIRAGIGGKLSYGIEWGGYDSVVEHNTFEGMGIGIGGWSSGTNLHIRHNVFRGCTNAVLIMGSSGTGYRDTYVYNNTFDLSGEVWNAGTVAFRCHTNTPVANTVIRNNVFTNARTTRPAICLTGINGNNTNWGAYVTNTVIDHNLFHNNSGGDLLILGATDVQVGTNLHANPGFRDVGTVPSPWYALRADSPCVAAGIDVGMPFTGTAPDIGASVQSINERIEAELGYSVASDAESTTISVFASDLSSFRAVRLPVVGDTIRLHYRVDTPGRYRLRLRVQAGETGTPVRLLDSGYRLDDIDTLLHPSVEPSSLSASGPLDGITWATLQVDLNLPGENDRPGNLRHLRVEALLPSAAVDHIELRLLPPATMLLLL